MNNRICSNSGTLLVVIIIVAFLIITQCDSIRMSTPSHVTSILETVSPTSDGISSSSSGISGSSGGVGGNENTILMDTNPIVNIHDSSSPTNVNNYGILNEIFSITNQEELEMISTLDKYGGSTSSIGVNFLKFMNFIQRTEQFHPLTDQEQHSGKFKKIAIKIINYILDRELIFSKNQSPILKLFDLSPSELLRMNNLMNNTREIVLQLSDSIISQHLTRIEPIEDDNDEFSLPLKQFVEKQLIRLKDFLIQIVKIYKTRKYNLKELGFDQEGNKNPLKYIVIGSGPIGLLSAIEASLLLPKLYIIEKRTNYSRDVWFDLYPKPFSQSVELLEELGFSTEFPNLEIKISSVADSDGDERRTYTVRCQITQRFLSKVIFLLDNVEFIFGSQYISQCKLKIPKEHGSHTYSLLENRWKEIGFKIMPEIEYQVALFYRGKSKECYSHIDYMSFNETFNLCSEYEQESFLDSKCQVERIPFDLLIGSDGLYSTVRSSLNISTHDVHTFDVSNTIYAQNLNSDQIPKITVKPKLEQVALIINFKRTEDNDCPDTAIDEDTGEFIDPWKPSLLLDNVCSVFKRFYAGHCHMQILFDNAYGQKAIEKYMQSRRNALKQLLDKNKEGSSVNSVILETEAKEIRSAAFADASRDFSYETPNSQQGNNNNRVISNWEEDAFDWIKIMSIVNTVLAEPYNNVNEFRDAIVNSDTFTGDKQLEKKYDMVLLRVVLQKAENLTKVIHLDNPSSPYAINILKGDSVASAHFRLGVGVNNAFLAFGEITTLIHNLVKRTNIPDTRSVLEKSLEIYEEKAQFRWNRLINYMATAMYFESFCNTVVFIDPGEYFGIQTIQQKDHDTLDYIPFENLYQVKRFCQSQDKRSLWWN